MFFLKSVCLLEHDDRRENRRRVSFKPGHFNKNKNKDWESSIRQHFEDEDIEMGAVSGPSGVHARYLAQRSRGRKGGGGRVGSPAPKGGGDRSGGRRKLFEGPINWYKVTVSIT